jgi:DNA polymerase-3 subunit delta
MLAPMSRPHATPEPPAAVTVVTGPEDLLADRAVAAVIAAARAVDPATEVTDTAPGTMPSGGLAVLASPSLFGERKVIVLRAAQDLPADAVAELTRYVAAPADDVALVVVHGGGVKGKAMLDAVRKAGAVVVECPRLTKPTERTAFVRNEIRGAGRTITEEATRALLDAVGNDLRELAAACSQLAADTEGTIDEPAVSRYYTGRAEASGFAVADMAVEGRPGEALRQLRWALNVGVAPVLITSALATGVRNIARLGAAPRGARPADLARELGMPPWKIDRVRAQLRGWSGPGIAAALCAVADADAAVKGAGDDPAYALERAVLAIAAARNSR